jgi:hypothetical protein
MSDQEALTVPMAVQVDPNACELVRVWIANNEQHVSLRSGVWEDPAAWGIMLADLARHVAETYKRDAGREVGATLQRIMAGIHAELG